MSLLQCCCGGHTISGCACTAIPDTLYAHVQSGPPPGLVTDLFSSTLIWQAKPASLAFYTTLDATGYYSDSEFTSTDGSYSFRYLFTCVSGFYVLGGITTPDSRTNYPQTFTIMSWFPGFTGNTCTPFSMHNGSTANAIYRSMGVTVDGTAPAPPPPPNVARSTNTGPVTSSGPPY